MSLYTSVEEPIGLIAGYTDSSGLLRNLPRTRRRKPLSRAIGIGHGAGNFPSTPLLTGGTTISMTRR